MTPTDKNKYPWAVNASKLERAIKKVGNDTPETLQVRIREVYESLGGLVDKRYWTEPKVITQVADVITPEETEVLVESIQEPVLTPESLAMAGETLSAQAPEGVLTEPEAPVASTDDINPNK